MSAHPPFPMVKLTIDHMRQEIVHAFMAYQNEAGEQVDAALKKAISEFDFETEVKRIARGMLEDMTRELVKNAVSEVKYDQAFNKKLSALVMEAMKKDAL